ncbi:L-dopachrome tautomerase-related protein [Acetobacter sp.]|uniref:L-dopachrome tautomerase-related protein n=1 Tax=Acetobacter sp. TaxID=440 RepID=UPI0025911123|nr:L-dopachrome tautomerase-related protein [Acetobacter sp.]MCC6104281.1 gluconolactonase [Acetobacter sp.]
MLLPTRHKALPDLCSVQPSSRTAGRVVLAALATVSLTLLQPARPALAVHMPKVPELPASALEPFTQSDKQVWDAVVMLPDGRALLEAPIWVGNTGPQLSVRSADGSFAPYPDATWNAEDGDASKRIVSIAGMTLLADGTLWVLDSGVPNHKAAAVAPAKLIQIDTRQNTVVRVVPIEASALHKDSVLSGVAVHENTAYVADSGVAGVLVIDLPSASAHRFLDRHPAISATRPIVTPDGPVTTANGNLLAIDSSMIAVSPDGKWIVVQPPGGYLSRVETTIFTDPDVTPAAMEESVTQWYKTPSLGGMTIGPDGTLYWSDISTGSILSYTIGRIPRRLITDPRLKWPATPGLDTTGHLYVPAAQLNHTAAFQNGKSSVEWPVTVYKLTLPTTPPPT